MSALCRRLLITVLLGSCISFCKSDLKDLTKIQNYFTKEQLSKAFNLLQPHYNTILKIYLQFGDLEQKFSTLSSKACYADIRRWMRSVLAGEDWAIKVLDAMAKLGNGRNLLQGNTMWFGSSFLCRNVSSPFMKTHHCWLNFESSANFKQAFSIRTEICLPASCQAEDINEALLHPLKVLFQSYGFTSPFKAMTCMEDIEEQSTESIRIITILIFASLVGLTISGTLYDIFLKTKKRNQKLICVSIYRNNYQEKVLFENKDFHQNTTLNGYNNRVIKKDNYQDYQNAIKAIMQCFSLLKNAPGIMDLSKKTHKLDCLYGIRTFCFAVVIYGHILIQMISKTDNKAVVVMGYSEYKPIHFWILRQLNLSTNVFFLLSGFLNAYYFLDPKTNCRRLTWFQFYKKRILRLVPVYYLAILFYIGFYLNRRSEKYEDFIDEEKQNCEDNLLANLFYVQNVVSDKCMQYTWYLANDMQFYLLSPLILVALERSTSQGIALIIGIIFSSSFSSFVISYVYDLNLLNWSNTIRFLKDLSKGYDVMYIKPYCRVGSYTMGMAFGWLIFKLGDNTKVQLKTRERYMMWLLVFFCSYGSVWFPYYFKLNDFLAAICYPLLREIFAFSVCLVIFLCYTGNGGIINEVLSWPIWRFFSRTSYSFFLLHSFVIKRCMEFIADDIHFLSSNTVIYFMTFFQITWISGVIFFFVVEAPVTNLQSALFEDGGTKTKIQPNKYNKNLYKQF